MAARRMKLFGENIVTLKKGYKREVLTSQIQKLIPKVQRKPLFYDIQAHAIQDYDTGLVRVKATFTKGFQEPMPASNCVFYVYAIDRATFEETLAYTSPSQTSPTLDTYFVEDFSEANLGEELLGEFDWAIVVEMKRFDRVFKKKFYFNQLGIYDFALRLKKRIDFLQITKKGIGE